LLFSLIDDQKGLAIFGPIIIVTMICFCIPLVIEAFIAYLDYKKNK
jgi:hypothetical protein